MTIQSSIELKDNNTYKAHPILKWAGGKGQLLTELRKYYPFSEGKIKKYVEPFIGGAAVLLDILNNYQLDLVYISDINGELINTYKVVRDNVEELIQLLFKMQQEYLPLDDKKRKEYYLSKREAFNQIKI